MNELIEKILREQTLTRAEKLTAIGLLFLCPVDAAFCCKASPRMVKRVQKIVDSLTPLFPPTPPLFPKSTIYKTNADAVQQDIDVVVNVVNKQDKTAKSSNARAERLWELFTTVQFGFTNSTQTVAQNVKYPKELCRTLASKAFESVDIEREIHSAAAWTLSSEKNQKRNLGTFLLNWFRRAVDNQKKVCQSSSSEKKLNYL